MALVLRSLAVLALVLVSLTSSAGLITVAGARGAAPAGGGGDTPLLTALGTISAGEWVEIEATDLNLFEAGSASNKTLAEFADEIACDEVDGLAHACYFVSTGDPYDVAGDAGFIRYDEETNDFADLSLPEWMPGPGATKIHEYDSLAIDPVARRLYAMPFGSPADDLWEMDLDSPGADWTQRASLTGTGGTSATAAIVWFPERNRLIACHALSGGVSAMFEWNPSNNTWAIISGSSFGEAHDLHQIAVYVPGASGADGVVICGGGNESNALRKLNSDGSSASVAAIPSGMNMRSSGRSVQAGACGKMMVYAGTSTPHFHTYTTASNTWSGNLTTGLPLDVPDGENEAWGMVFGNLPEFYNAIIAIESTDVNRMWAYKAC